MKPSTLKQLAGVLRNAPPADNTSAQIDYADSYGLPRQLGVIDLTSLPTFGGSEPANTVGVWSWDEQNLLVGVGDEFKLVPRGEL